ncbi:MAG: monofunctional biosynthetic peptidoglycan transglycosylase [Bacteroidetes bacterium]|nr:monofunctional biosynthetic peptidoglycan transglycosylase [Bacteroidota bacterium]
MKNFLKKIWRFFLRFLKWFFIISVVSVILFRWIPIPYTPFMLVQCVEQMFDSKREVKLKKDWVSLEEISPNLLLAVVCSEDQNFLEHNGFDFDAIEKAVKHNKNHKRKRGASTISQQTAKNVFLYDGRNWIRKGFEVYFTFMIELFWNKERIMKAYLNVIEFGDGVYGAEAASQEFFHISAKKLSREQAALLAAVLPAPKKFSVKNPSPYVRRRQQWILGQMENFGELKFDEEEKEKK